jgi:hypothetical protein
MLYLDPLFIEQVRRASLLASSLGRALHRGFQDRIFEIPPEWEELWGCLQSINPRQLAILPPLAKERLIALGKLANRAKRIQESIQFVSDFHELFPDFNSAGLNLWEALKGIPVETAHDLGWADQQVEGLVDCGQAPGEEAAGAPLVAIKRPPSKPAGSGFRPVQVGRHDGSSFLNQCGPSYLRKLSPKLSRKNHSCLRSARSARCWPVGATSFPRR